MKTDVAITDIKYLILGADFNFPIPSSAFKYAATYKIIGLMHNGANLTSDKYEWLKVSSFRERLQIFEIG